MTDYANSTEIDHSATSTGSSLMDSGEMKMQRFLRWMEENGATFPAMTIKTGPGGRQVHASRTIVPGALVLHVPRKLMITPEVAKASETGKLIAQHKPELGNTVFIAAFLTQIKREGGFWKPYVDIMPTDFSHMPLLFSEFELNELKGAYALREVRDRLGWNAFVYRQLPACLIENGLTQEEFTWARCVVSSRLFGVMAAGSRTSALVPMADMFDHAPEHTVRWGRRPQTGFTLVAEQAVEAGASMSVTYGDKCNAILLAYYGFCLEDNPDNRAEILVQPLSAGHPFSEHAESFGTRQQKLQAFRVPARFHDKHTLALFSYLRLAFLDGTCAGRQLVNEQGKVPPISRANEIAVLNALLSACQRRMREFATSIEQDEELLEQGALSRNVRNAVKVRHGEKVVLRYFLELAQTALPVFEDASCDMNKYAADGKPYADYFADVARSFARRVD
jgi:histone-lysine N-methyltransferase SETD3